MDTGSYIFNGLISGSINGGMHSGNKITAIAGESSTDKDFLLPGSGQELLDSESHGGVVYFDTESAITKSLLTRPYMLTPHVFLLST